MTPIPTPPPPPKYVVVTHWGTPHGSLWDIADELFEDGAKWHDIYAQNRKLIGGDPDSIRAGMRLQMPPLEIYPKYIRAVGDGFISEAEDINGKLLNARERLGELGNFWGTDSLGASFYNGANGTPGYRVRSAQALDGVDAFSAFYRNIAAGLHAMADREEKVEWENTVTVLTAALKDSGS